MRADLWTIVIVLPLLTFRTYHVLPHINNYFRRLCSYLDLLQKLLGYQGGFAPLGYPRGPWGRRSR